MGERHDWAATANERACLLPGDDLVFEPASVSTRAVTINAPAAEVWKWLVQVRRDRGGWYQHQWLENLFGLDIRDPAPDRRTWQRIAEGDQAWMVPAGALGMNDGYAFRVAGVEPGRALVLRQSPPDRPWDATWSFVLAESDSGRCRLVVRSRSRRLPGIAGKLAWIGGELLDPIMLIMTRKMLLGIRARAEFAAEQRHRLGSARPRPGMAA